AIETAAAEIAGQRYHRLRRIGDLGVDTQAVEHRCAGRETTGFEMRLDLWLIERTVRGRMQGQPPRQSGTKLLADRLQTGDHSIERRGNLVARGIETPAG